MDIMGINFPAS